jgi:hypothetical protein
MKNEPSILVPQKAQRILLRKLQDIIEGTCYRYGQRELVHALSNNGWECEEAAELGSWVEVLEGDAEVFKKLEGGERHGVLSGILDIQPAVSDRMQRIDCKGFITFLSTAVELANMLQDDRQREVFERP